MDHDADEALPWYADDDTDVGDGADSCFSSEQCFIVVATMFCMDVLAIADWNLDLGSCKDRIT